MLYSTVSGVIKININIQPITQAEIDDFNSAGINGDYLSLSRKAVVFIDENGNSGKLYIGNNIIEELGPEYIATHSKLEYSEYLKEWIVKLSQNDFRNDLKRNPPKTIQVKFIEDKNNEKTEIYQSLDTGEYYLRMLCSSSFARWMTCGNKQTGWLDQNEIRPNITFQHGNQTETTRYDDWNGSAVYSDTFNPYFRNGKM